MSNLTQHCGHTKNDRTPCKANVQTGSTYCFFHDPTTVEQRLAARRAGGVQRSGRAAVLDPSTPDLPLRRPKDVVKLIAQTINEVRRGQLDPRIANSIGQLVFVL